MVLPEPTSATDSQPEIGVPPSEKATFPVGATPVTLAVNVTETPTREGLAALVTPVVDTPLLTTCVKTVLADALLFASPP